MKDFINEMLVSPQREKSRRVKEICRSLSDISSLEISDRLRLSLTRQLRSMYIHLGSDPKEISYRAGHLLRVHYRLMTDRRCPDIRDRIRLLRTGKLCKSIDQLEIILSRKLLQPANLNGLAVEAITVGVVSPVSSRYLR